jgi:hypothetical protein
MQCSHKATHGDGVSSRTGAKLWQENFDHRPRKSPLYLGATLSLPKYKSTISPLQAAPPMKIHEMAGAYSPN